MYSELFNIKSALRAAGTEAHTNLDDESVTKFALGLIHGAAPEIELGADPTSSSHPGSCLIGFCWDGCSCQSDSRGGDVLGELLPLPVEQDAA